MPANPHLPKPTTWPDIPSPSPVTAGLSGDCPDAERIPMSKILAIAYLSLLALLIGWIINIVKLISMVGGEVSAMFIARCVGVFAAPLGGVLGFF